MLDGIPIDLPNLGATALLSLTVILVLTGKIVPVRVVRKMEEAARVQAETIRSLMRQNDDLISRVEVPTRVLESLREAARRREDEP